MKGVSTVIWVTVVMVLAAIVLIFSIRTVIKSGEAGERGLNATERGLLSELEQQAIISRLCPGEGRASHEGLGYRLASGNLDGKSDSQHHVGATFNCTSDKWGSVDRCIFQELKRTQRYQESCGGLLGDTCWLSTNKRNIATFNFIYGQWAEREFKDDETDPSEKGFATNEKVIKIPTARSVIDATKTLNFRSEYFMDRAKTDKDAVYLHEYEFSIPSLVICCSKDAKWDIDSKYCLKEGETAPQRTLPEVECDPPLVGPCPPDKPIQTSCGCSAER